MSRLSRPSAAQVAERLVVLKFIVAHAMIAPPRDMLNEWMRSWPPHEYAGFEREATARNKAFWQKALDAGLWEELSPEELELASATIVTMTQQQQVNASWRIEAAQVLMWALELIPELPPYDTQASHDLLREIPKMPDFAAQARLR
ncbi:MAG TPA: DUF4272 domain-containing protein, partial [Pirellulaceae bacterium]|nr:DUF4272 domain-containing protein [Pirellulaceae bacterium]